MSFRTGMIALGLAIGLAACTQAEAPASTAVAETAAAVHPESGLPIVPLTITSGGKNIDFRVEYTTTPQAEMKGLMFRTELGPNEGMLFPNKIMNPGAPPAPRSFYMKNTVIPLDLIFIAPDSAIESIAANAVPYSLELDRIAGAGDRGAGNSRRARGGTGAEGGRRGHVERTRQLIGGQFTTGSHASGVAVQSGSG